MSIRIGRTPQPPTDLNTTHTPSLRAERTFDGASTLMAPASAAKVDAVAPGPFDDLQKGRIDANEYANRKVLEATHHLDGLPAHELDDIRRLLGDMLRSDPALAQLVEIATGQAPSPSALGRAAKMPAGRTHAASPRSFATSCSHLARSRARRL